MPVNELVVAAYATRDGAEAAVRQLQRAGLDPRTLSIVEPEGAARAFWGGLATLWQGRPESTQGFHLLVRGTREDAMRARELLHDALPEALDEPEAAPRS